MASCNGMRHFNAVNPAITMTVTTVTAHNT